MYSRIEKIDDFRSIQDGFINSIYTASPLDQGDAVFGINEILSITQDVEIFNLAFGETGVRLLNLITDFDIDHPEIKYGDFLLKDKVKTQTIIDYLSLCNLAKANDLEQTISLFNKNIVKSIFSKADFDLIKNRQNLVRLFKNKETRENYRKIKEARLVLLSNYDKKLYEFWNCDLDFSRFGRFGTFYYDEMKSANEKIDAYKGLGLDFLANEIQQSLDAQEKNFSYYGFQRITVNMTVIGLAKLHGYYMENNSIKIPHSFYGFEKLNWQRPEYLYGPIVFPVHELKNSVKITDLINHLESFPDANGKPIFDHFLVVSPGPKFPATTAEFSSKPFDLLDINGKIVEFTDGMTAKKFLEHTLINGGYVQPVLLGEKDGKCYFICFWE